jgi:hypothetical protein
MATAAPTGILALEVHGMGGIGMMALILADRPVLPLRQLTQLPFERALAVSGRPHFRVTPKAIGTAELSTSGSPP